MDEYVDRLRGRADVAVTERNWIHDDRGEFEAARRRAERLRGSVVVAVTNDDGAVLLVENGWMDGYGFPGGGVEPGEDWEAAAVREVREETGVAVEIDRPFALEVGAHVYDGADGRERRGGNYGVRYLASPTGEETVAADPGVDDEEIERVGWFDEVPERAFQPEAIRSVLDGEV